jgi:hypothetical protein
LHRLIAPACWRLPSFSPPSLRPWFGDDDFADDSGAIAYYRPHGCKTATDAFNIANILHTASKARAASKFYRIAFDMHSKESGQFPLAQALLQARLLCLLKAGDDLPQAEMAELSRLCLPYANYISGVHAAWRCGDFSGSLALIDNAFEEFRTGEEIDSLYLDFALKSGLDLSKQRDMKIPNKLFLYWDRNPPAEICDNLLYHEKIDELEVKIFNQEYAEQWLYSVYGVEARSIFLNSRHPAEAADIFRVHVVQACGGWWLDADVKLRDGNSVSFMTSQRSAHVFFVTHNNVVHNDLFGATANSPVLAECLLNIYRNCYLHHGLSIAYKTGPGVFNRAINRCIRRHVLGVTLADSIDIFDQNKFNEIIEEFDTPYKTLNPHWQAV